MANGTITATPPPVPAPEAAAPRAGTPGRAFVEEAGEMAIFAVRAIMAVPRAPLYMAEVMRQASIVIRGTSLMMLVMNAFLGFSVANFAYFFFRAIGATDYIGVLSAFAEPRLLATSMFGYVFTAKVCTGIASQLGAMQISQEIEALESEGVDPMQYLVGTRILAALIFVPIGTVIALIGQILGTYFATVILIKGIFAHVLLDTHWSFQSGFDQMFALITIGAIALATTIIACFYGMRAKGGPAGVGNVAARSLAVNIVVVHVIAGVFAVLFYGTNIRLPIGG